MNAKELQTQLTAAQTAGAGAAFELASSRLSEEEARCVEKWQGCEVAVRDLVELKNKTLDEYRAGVSYLVEMLESGLADLAEKEESFRDLGLQIRNTACAHYSNDKVELNNFLIVHKDALEIHLPLETPIDWFRPVIRAWLSESGQDVRVLHFTRNQTELRFHGAHRAREGRRSAAVPVQARPLLGQEIE